MNIRKLLNYGIGVLRNVSIFSYPNVIGNKILKTKRRIYFRDGTSVSEISLPLLANFCNRGKIVDSKYQIYEWNVNGQKYYANYEQANSLLSEYVVGEFDQIYGDEIRGKRILDIGGFIGDTARYYLDNGAEYVDIYEPIEANMAAMKKNLEDYSISKYKINTKGVSKDEGVLEIYTDSEPGRSDFGTSTKPGEKKYSIQCTSFDRVLEENNYDIAKVDCEGCEIGLANLDDKMLRRIKTWIIETHNEEIDKQVVETFNRCGFEHAEMKKVNDGVRIIKFSLNKG